MEQIMQILTENNIGYLATVEDGNPRVRPFGFGFEEDGKYFFCTNNIKDVYTQLKKVPYVEYSVTSKSMVTVRIRGKIEFTKDINAKEKMIDASGIVKSKYKTATNPIFEVFYVQPEQIIVSTLDGKPSRVYKF